jgi:hypothetical protein
MNPCAFQQAANHNGFGPRPGLVDDNCFLARGLFAHLPSPPFEPIMVALGQGMSEADKRASTTQEIDEESRRVRRLRIAVQLALDVISQGELPPEEAAELMAATRRVALQLFPGKEHAFDLIYRPKFQRLMAEVYRLQ